MYHIGLRFYIRQTGKFSALRKLFNFAAQCILVYTCDGHSQMFTHHSAISGIRVRNSLIKIYYYHITIFTDLRLVIHLPICNLQHRDLWVFDLHLLHVVYIYIEREREIFNIVVYFNLV